jgi:hypothetical protein
VNAVDPADTHATGMRRLAVLLLLAVSATAAGLVRHPEIRGITFGCGLIVVAGIVAAMLAEHFKRQFDREAGILLNGAGDSAP